jgi:protein-L-isoaspartate(D-aspartate) O-methyltransferase
MKPQLPLVPAAASAARPRPSFPAKLAQPPRVGKPNERATSPAPSALTPSANAQPVAQRTAVPIGAAPDLQAVRAAMVRKLQAQGLAHPAVLAALHAVERHRFVDSALASQAYEDTSLPIGLGQTISKPNVVARMLELLCHGRSDKLGRVLEIGTGCGYQAALLSHLSHEVYSIERLRGMHQRARDNLRWFRLPNLHLLLGDGMLGYAPGAPYAAILAAAGGQDIPQAWVDQLAVGGRLVAPATVEPGRQHLVVIDKTATGCVRSVLEAVLFVPLKSGVE